MKNEGVEVSHGLVRIDLLQEWRRNGLLLYPWFQVSNVGEKSLEFLNQPEDYGLSNFQSLVGEWWMIGRSCGLYRLLQRLNILCGALEEIVYRIYKE